MVGSADGDLTLLTIQSLITHQLPVLVGVISILPLTDLSASRESYILNEKIDVISNMNYAKRLSPYLLSQYQSEFIIPLYTHVSI